VHNFLIIYDISDDKRRKKVSDVLEGIGIRVNFSVFEVQINTVQLTTIEEELISIIQPNIDSIRIYHICKNCVSKSKSLSNQANPFEVGDYFV
jgi:CRISPR-associated protein Cas2